MNIKFKLIDPEAELPKKMSENAAGYDVYANNKNIIVLEPLQRCLVPTGFALQLPNNVEAQIRSRSGLALKRGISVLNSPGTIDPDYRGEVKVLLVNLSDEVFIVYHGLRIAQLVFSEFVNVDFEIVEELDETGRADYGFGST